jgi:xylan 1,4-beta-xylosidase
MRGRGFHAPVTDENGDRYLIWKKDGNSQKQPTPLMIQKLSDDGTQLVGERREIIRNDQPWEGQLVEGPYVLRRDGWFYLFYAGAGCCGLRCDYKVGVARSKTLFGPYEKNPSNPIMAGNDNWRCPGHGSLVTDPQGRMFFIYHAYDANDFIYTGRQALLDEVKWNADGWPRINSGSGPSVSSVSPYHQRQSNNRFDFVDDFRASTLAPDWEWPWQRKPEIVLDPSAGGWLMLKGSGDDRVAAVLAQYPRSGNYTATTRVDTGSLSAGAWAGLTAYGDDKNALGIGVSKDQILIWRRKDGVERTTASAAASGGDMYLRMNVTSGKDFHFAFSRDGRAWTDIEEQLGGEYLPPWDLAVRIALTVGGVPGATARFDYLRITAARSLRRAKSAGLVNHFKPQL